LCISKGSITSKGLANAALYTLSSGYSGIIVVAENYNDKFFLHIELDCDNSSNVVSTRRTLVTKDSVPPLHRQVLLVLTQLETSSSYSINYSMKYRLSSNPYLNTWPGAEGHKEVNMPRLNTETFGLHSPRSIFN
jgi:calpain-15